MMRSISAACSAPLRSSRYGLASGTRTGLTEPWLVAHRDRRPVRGVQHTACVAVVGAEPRQHDVAVGLAVGEVVGAGELERRLVGLAAAAHREHAGSVHRHHLGDVGGESRHRLGRELRGMHVLEQPGLCRHRRHDLGPSVPDRAGDRAAGTVEDRAPVGGDDRAPRAAHGDGTVRSAVEHVVGGVAHRFSFAGPLQPSGRLFQ